MENTENPIAGEKKKRDNTKILLLILLLIFAGTTGVLGYLLSVKKEQIVLVESQKADLSAAKEALNFELESLKSEHDKLSVDYGQLTEELKAKDSLLQDKMAQLQKMINAGVTIDTFRKIKAELETIRKLNKGYFVQIDSLNQANSRLREENQMVKTELKGEKDKTEQLSKEKEALSSTVEMGSKLGAYDIASDAIIYKSGGKREKITEKAKRVDKIRTCLTVGANSIAKSGKRAVILKIIAPNGKILSKKTDDSNTFMVAGEKEYYSARKEFEYTNEEIDLCLYFDRYEDLPEGKYEVLVYIDDLMIGKSSFELN